MFFQLLWKKWKNWLAEPCTDHFPMTEKQPGSHDVQANKWKITQVINSESLLIKTWHVDKSKIKSTKRPERWANTERPQIWPRCRVTLFFSNYINKFILHLTELYFAICNRTWSHKLWSYDDLPWPTKLQLHKKLFDQNHRPVWFGNFVTVQGHFKPLASP